MRPAEACRLRTRHDMTMQSHASAWDRLQAILLSLKPGETITVDQIVADTELTPETVRMILDGLAKAGLFERRGESAFVRRSLFRELLAAIAIPMSDPAQTANQVGSKWASSRARARSNRSWRSEDPGMAIC